MLFKTMQSTCDNVSFVANTTAGFKYVKFGLGSSPAMISSHSTIFSLTESQDVPIAKIEEQGIEKRESIEPGVYEEILESLLVLI